MNVDELKEQQSADLDRFCEELKVLMDKYNVSLEVGEKWYGYDNAPTRFVVVSKTYASRRIDGYD